MEVVNYSRLLDKEHRDTVIKFIGRDAYSYKNSGEWVRTGIMSHYFLPYGIYYDMYEDITEEEARKYLPPEAFD